MIEIWNGKELTEPIRVIQVREGKYETFSQIAVGTSVGWVILKGSASIQSCIIDEMKPVFGVEKIGTRWTRSKSRYLIIYRVLIDSNGEPIPFHPWNGDRTNFEFRKLVLFRNILNIGNSTESYYRICDGRIFNFREVSLNPSKPTTYISIQMLLAYKIDAELLRTVLGVRTLTTVSIEIENVLKRVDPKSITAEYYLTRRIQDRLY